MSVDLKAVKEQIETGKTKETPLYLYGRLAVLLHQGVQLGIYFWPEQHTPINYIAVLPLENLSGDSVQELFVDGMTDALITELSKIETLGMTSRTSAMRYKNTKKLIPVIANELHLGALVEGSTLHIGDRVRITPKLIEAETDQRL